MITELEREIRQINHNNGWNVLEAHHWESDPHKIPTMIALLHSELSEALEAYRHNDRENFAEEMADVFIRLLDLTGGLDFLDLEAAVRTKLAVNRGRGYRHGGKRV